MKNLQYIYIKRVLGPCAVVATIRDFLNELNDCAGGDWRQVRQVYAGPRLIKLANAPDSNRKCAYLRSSCGGMERVTELSVNGVQADGIAAIGEELIFVYIS